MEMGHNINSIKAQLQRVERQKHALERQIAALQQQKITALPEQVGLPSIDSLLIALIPFASQALRAKLQAIGIDQMSVRAPDERTGRTRFSSELKDSIRRELGEGRKSVAKLSREYGPSHATIMGWKREWGMTRPRARRRQNGADE